MATKSIAKRKAGSKKQARLTKGERLIREALTSQGRPLPGSKKRELDDAEKLFRKERRAPARMSKDELYALEARLNDPEFHLYRRFALGIQSMSGSELGQKIESDRETAIVFAEAAAGIRDYIANERNFLDFLNAAQLRVELLLCARTDCKEVREEARQGNETGARKKV